MKHHQSSTSLIAIVAALTLSVYAVYGYMYYRIGVLVERVGIARSTLAAQQISSDQARNLTALHASTQADRIRLRSYFIPDEDTVTFIEMVEALGTGTGAVVSLTAIDADELESAKEGTVGHIRAQVDVSGSWVAVMKTLKLAEHMPYGVSVSAVRIAASAPSDTQPTSRSWKASFAVDGLVMRLSR